MIYKPDEYAKQVYGGAITGATVRNWIKRGKLPSNACAEKTPTGQWLIKVDEVAKSEAQILVDMIEGAA